MHEGYGSHSMSVSVCYCASCYIPRLYVEKKVLLGFLWHFQDMHCVAFVENTLFKSSGDTKFADNLCLPRFLTSSRWTKETAMASFQED